MTSTGLRPRTDWRVAPGDRRSEVSRLEPRISRMGTDEEGHAGTPGARAGGVFASSLPSELEDGPSKTPLHSLRE